MGVEGIVGGVLVEYDGFVGEDGDKGEWIVVIECKGLWEISGD